MIKSKINNYKDSKIFNIINKLLYKLLNSECKLLYVSSPGSSPSKVYMFKDENNRMYAVKICDVNISRVPLYQEVDNMKFLKPFLNNHLPKIIYVGTHKNLEIMISQCFGVDNFYSSLISNRKPINFYFDIWNKVLLEIMLMWKKSINYNYESKFNPRSNKSRIQRIETGVLNSEYNGYTLKFIKNLTIVVNGIEYISIEDAFNEIKKIEEPAFGVTCHGDPQPSNIIISENDDNWYLVDWEWSGNNHDFRLMFSHLYGWWATRMINSKTKPMFIVRDNKIIINYEVYKNDIIDEFQIMSKNTLNKYFNIEESDIDSINCFLALLYFGDIRFLNIWGRQDYLPILIGEAVKTICFVIDKCNSVNSNFTFSQEKK